LSLGGKRDREDLNILDKNIPVCIG